MYVQLLTLAYVILQNETVYAGLDGEIPLGGIYTLYVVSSMYYVCNIQWELCVSMIAILWQRL